MKFATSIKIKKRAANYYTDFIERYFEAISSQYGLHFVKNPEQAEYSLFMIFDDSPWMTIASNDIDHLDALQLEKLSNEIALTFKTVTKVEAFSYTKIESVYKFHFSSKHSAFEEPAFIEEGATVLNWSSSDVHCQSGKRFYLSCLNVGGISKGLEILISGSFVENDTVELDPIEIHTYEYMSKEKKQIVHTSNKQKSMHSDGKMYYLYDFDDFEFPEGINLFSAKLRGKKGDQQRNDRSITLVMVPRGEQCDLNTIKISILPKTNKDCGVHWHKGRPMNYKWIIQESK